MRYDKLMKEREGKEKEYYEGLMRARIADEERDDRERKWQRQLGLDKRMMTDTMRAFNIATSERRLQMTDMMRNRNTRKVGTKKLIGVGKQTMMKTNVRQTVPTISK